MLVFLFSAALVGQSPSIPETSWKAGFSRVDITPTEPVWMAGYASRTKPAEGKASELFARGMALADPQGARGLILALDLVGVDATTSARWCDRIMSEHGLPRKAIVLACSHTHCGPVVGSTLRDMYPVREQDIAPINRYEKLLEEKVLEAARGALAHLAPVSLTWHDGTCSFAVNRRNNPETSVEKLKAEGALKGPVDHTVPVLVARDPQGKPKGVLFGYACHATTMSFQQWYGDWPGEACANLEQGIRTKRGDNDGVAVFLAGCGADQNPLPRRRLELAQGYGKQLADSVRHAGTSPGKEVRGNLGMAFLATDLPLEAPPGRDKLLEQRESQDKALAARARRLLALVEAGGDLPTRYPAPLQAWAIGDSKGVVFLPGEVVVDYALRLPRELEERNWWVASYANDVMAYIPSKRVRQEGGYEGATSMVYYGLPAPWREEVEETLVAGVRQVAEMALEKAPDNQAQTIDGYELKSKRRHFLKWLQGKRRD